MKKKILFLFPMCVLMICGCGNTLASSSLGTSLNTTTTSTSQDKPSSDIIIEDNSVRLYDLRVNDETNPLGIDDNIHFSWKMDSQILGENQQAYQIIVKENNDVVWDSGRIYGSDSVAIPYGGLPLSSATKYSWTVNVVEKDGKIVKSPTQHFETGLLGRSAFIDTHFISHSAQTESLPAFRKSLTISKPIKSARLYTSGLGVYESYINGKRVGRIENGKMVYQELKPGYTENKINKFYTTYDVTDYLSNGENVLSSLVGNGWWIGYIGGWAGQQLAYMAKLVITFTDGSQQIINTDTSWKSSINHSPYILADIYDGETYDARRGLSWMKPSYNDSSWTNVRLNDEFSGELRPWQGSFITVHDDKERTVKNINIYDGVNGSNSDRYGKINVLRSYDANREFTLNPSETAVIDFGQNASGFEKIVLSAEQDTRITIRHGEMLNDNEGLLSRNNDGPEGSLYTANLRSAKATTTYISSGAKNQEYSPLFTFYGFRYIEIKVSEPVTFHSVTALTLSSAKKDTGSIITSNADINQFLSNSKWGMYSNYLAVPTDCPQRDERQGWTGDAQNFALAGCYFNDSKSFLEKYLSDLRDGQQSTDNNGAYGAYPSVGPTGPFGYTYGDCGWSDAGIIIPYYLYMMYGDTSIISEYWESMTRYMDIYLASTNKIGPHHTYNDWLSYENATNDEQIATMLSVSYYAWDARLMSVMANALGLKDEQAKYQRVYEEEKEYFIKNFVNSDGSLKRGEQTVCLYALYLDLLPSPTSVERVTEQLITNLESKGNKLQTGFLGTEIILTTLSKIGRTDMAYRILLQHDCPSWLYSVDQGATTIWERWNSYTVMDGFIDADPVSGDLMNSFNHYSYGSASAWIFNTMAGINYSESSPGFKEIVLAPQIDQAIKKVEASYESSYGTIISNYEVANGTLTYDCKIPCNTTASIKLEIEDINSLKINGKSYNQCTLENDGVEFLTDYRGTVIFNAVSGSYKFTSDIEELNVLSMKTMTGDVALGDLITKVNDTYVSVSSYVKMHEGDVVSISLKNSSLIEKYQWVDENQNPISSNAELINYKINKDSLIYLVRK